MIVTAALPWYDEQPEDLDRYVRALPVLCDRLVAVDGGYEQYPGAEPTSHPEQAAAIEAAARDIGIECEIVSPTKVWRGQVEKRSYLYEIAADGSDWVATLDADHILHGDREDVRLELAAVTHDSIEVEFHTTMNINRPLTETAATEWHARLAGKSIRTRLVLRALPGMRVERFHWYVSALRGTERVWLTAVQEGPWTAHKGHWLVSPFVVEHRCLFRHDRNIMANREFCEDRIGIVAATGQEDVLVA